MTHRAQVTSVEALEAFRSDLIIYLKKARPVLEEIADDVRRTRSWLQTDQRTHWKNEARRCRREWEQAQQALFSAKLSQFQSPTAAQQGLVNRTKRALEAAEEKLRLLTQWNRKFENLTDPLVKQMGQLHSFLVQDLPKAAAYLGQAVRTLEAYAEIASPMAPVNPAPENGSGARPHPDESPPVSLPPVVENEGRPVPGEKTA